MRVALFTDGITPYVTGGMQRHSYYLCKYLASRGVYVDLYHCDPHKRRTELKFIFSEKEMKFITEYLVQFPIMKSGYGHYIRESYEYSRRIYSLYSKNTRPDFIYAKGFTAWELLNQKSKGENFPPIGVNFHGYEMFQQQPSLMSSIKSNLLFKSPVKFNIQHADYLFSYGGQISSIIRSLGYGEKIIDIPGGIDADWIGPKSDSVHQPLRFLFVGRNERRKGIEELNKAIRKLQKSHRGKFEFEFVGDIPASKKVGGCHYHGELRDKEALQKVYRAADVLVAPSYSEGMPNVILEGMSSGLMVIATDVGAVSGLVNESTGWLLADPKPETIYNALVTALSLEKTKILHGKLAAQQLVLSKFTWQQVGEQNYQFLLKFSAK